MVMEVEIYQRKIMSTSFSRICHTIGDCVDSDASLNPDDADGDGVTSCDGDCDDSNPSVLPSATEICNEIDDDCDGLLNEEDDSWDVGSGIEVFIDNDGDGSGAIENSEVFCSVPEGFVTQTGDCDNNFVQRRTLMWIVMAIQLVMVIVMMKII